MNLELDMTREQIVEAISTIFILERKYNIKYPLMEHSILDKLNFELHKAIKPTKEEWIKTEYFNKYFTDEAKEKYLKNK